MPAGAHNRLAQAPTGQLIIIGVLGIAAQARTIIATHKDAIAGIQNDPVIDLLDDLHIRHIVVDSRVVDCRVVDDSVVNDRVIDDVCRLRNHESRRVFDACAFLFEVCLNFCGSAAFRLSGIST